MSGIKDKNSINSTTIKFYNSKKELSRRYLKN